MKDITLRNRIWVKPRDQMDVWLDTQGYYRKHTARDGTCLFRAVSEQIFLTQAFHLEVRNQIMDFVLRHADIYQKMVTCPLSEYIEKMRNPREWGGKLEIDAMAQMYRYDFLLYQEIGNPPETVTHYGFEDKVLLCYSQERHYDSVYTKDYISSAALCQSMIYELLYKNVFELKEVDYAVNKMLHDKTSRYQRDHISLLNTGFALRFEMRDSYLNVKELLDIGITPFPYKVAKSLDPEVYRNVEYDTWNDYRKGLRYGLYVWNCRELQVGVKCLVKLDETTYHGHIQDMQANKGPVVVFIEELGEKVTVSYDCLELLPPPPPQTPPQTPTKPSLPFKLQALPLILSKPGKKLVKCGGVRSKSKESDNGKKCHKENSRESHSPQTSVVTSPDYYDQDVEYQQDAMTSYEHSFVSQRNEGGAGEEQLCPDSTKPGLEGEPMGMSVPVESCHYQVQSASHHHHQHHHQMDQCPPVLHPPPLTVNLMAPKSLNSDGSDLPHSGLDHLRMNCVLRPGPPYYLNTGVLPPGYVAIDNSNVQPYEHHGFPPSVSVKRNSSLYEGPPLIQQCEVSSTTNNPPPPPPPPVGMSVPVSPVYYPPLECEPYCMSVSYMDYGLYDYGTAAVYQQPPPPPGHHPYSAASYLAPDGLLYQPVIAPQPTAVLQTPPQV